MPERLGLGVAVGAALLPWTVVAYLSHTSPYMTFLDGPAYAYTAVGLLLGAAALGAFDFWLGLLVAYAAAGSLVVGTDLSLATAHWMLLGAAGLVVVRHVQPAWARGALVASAVAQVALAGGQAVVYAEPLITYGTFGNTKYLGAFLAVVTPLAPIVLLPALLLGVVMSRSGTAALAVLVGLLLRPGVSARWRLGAGLLGMFGVAGVLIMRGTKLETLGARWTIWRLALSDFTPWTLLTGHGFGAWYMGVPTLQMAHGVRTQEMFTRSHSDLVQLAYEGGLIALVILAGWLWSHRRALLTSPWRGAAVAVGLEALALHPFHLSTVAPACVVVLGLATRKR